MTRTSRRAGLLVCMGLGIAALCAPAAVDLPVRLIYNVTDSVPRGWYRVDRVERPESLRVGSIVLARLPAEMAALAAQRGYLPADIPLLKRIGAVAPQSVCVHGHLVRIDDAIMAISLAHDGMRRPLPMWPQCRRLRDEELFLLSGTNSASFDSRYFGPIAASAVLGVARPVRTWWWTGNLS
jgi:conjugative transfer signal peptidase TraF